MAGRSVSLLLPARLLLAVLILTGAVSQVTSRAAPPDAAYCLVADWPNLPAELELGQVAGLGVDSRGVVYVFHRGDKGWPSQPSLATWARDLLVRLFQDDKTPDLIARDTVLALDPATGTRIAAFGARQFRIPHGLTVDPEDNIWVTDVGLHQVFKFSRDGELLLTLGEAGQAGAGRARFDGPTDVAVAADGSVYVADGYGNARVVKFSRNGGYLMEWGGRGAAPGQFDLPHGIAIDSHGDLYVADRGNARIQVFDGDGRFRRQISGPEIGRPWAVDLGPDGVLYALDGGDQDPERPRSGLLALTPQGEVIARWSGYGYEAGSLVWPHDLAVSSNSEVFVGEVFDANRIQKFRPGCRGWAHRPAAPG